MIFVRGLVKGFHAMLRLLYIVGQRFIHMDRRGQTSTEYLLLTAVGVLVAVIGYLSIITLMDRAKDSITLIQTYRDRLVLDLSR